MHWQQASATGAQLLWRVAEHRLLPVKQMLPDGSYLSEIKPSPADREEAGVSSLAVRVSSTACPVWRTQHRATG